ncbi:nucleoside-diphosphate kinase [Dehalobacterium formicoaceticum]|uniref:nucleoside-diphosphate kinase n=1 Tax=Dehalobacterium formicoaceticum TaxID=51515 RepID=UPI000B7C8618|nr:nucleoside-diphosphate kinase [Dehalobacterium formicoaceticum]
MEKTYVMIKPDGVQRNLTGEIINRFEKKGLKLTAMKFLRLSPEQAEAHYQEHVGKKFYDGLISFITSGPVVAMVWEGENAVSAARKLMGSTNPAEADPASIRGMYGLDLGRNIIHGADSVESAGREIAIYFQTGELISYEKNIDQWIYE